MKKIPQVEKTRKYYDKEFSLWAHRKTHSFHYEKQFTKIVSLWPEKASIIDIGCANGIHVPLFLGIGRKLKYTGVDISKSFIKIAQRRYPQLTFSLADISDSDTFPKKKFEGFMAAAVLMHIPLTHWDSMFTNIERLIKPGGFGYVVLPIAHPSKQINLTDTRHFTILSEQEQREYFKSRGWKIKHAGIADGFTTEAVWRWYIVQLPST